METLLKKVDNREEYYKTEPPVVLTDKDKIRIFNEWKKFIDFIAPKISPGQQVIYGCLFWLSIGQCKKECNVSYDDIKKLTKIKAGTTIGVNIDKLAKARLLKVLQRGFNLKSRYRVYSPLEILTPDKNDNEEVKKIQKQGADKNDRSKTKTKK